MEGYVNKEVFVNIELFLLVFVHEKSPRRAFAANECLMVSYGFLPSILQVWVAEGWQVCYDRDIELSKIIAPQGIKCNDPNCLNHSHRDEID